MVTLRRISTFAVAGGLALATAVLGGAPALAASAPVFSISAPANFYVTPPAGSKSPDQVRLQLSSVTAAGNSTSTKKVAITVDATALQGKVEVIPEPGCAAQKTYVWTCTVGTVSGGLTYVPFTVRQAAGAKVGDHGTVTYSASSDNAATATASETFTVGDVDLLPRVHAKATPEPGTPFDVTPALENDGNTPAQGVGLTLWGPDGLRLARDFDNCWYAGPDTPEDNAVGYCLFEDTTVDPGQAYEVRQALSYTPVTSFMYGYVQYSWWALSGPDPDGLDRNSFKTRGTGDDLQLVPTAASATGFAKTGGRVDVAAGQHADYAAEGGVIKGAAGATTHVQVGVKNLGPGSLELGDLAGGDNAGVLTVAFPKGITVKYPPSDDGQALCSTKDTKDGSAETWECPLDSTFYADHEQDFSFTVKIGAAADGATGSVSVTGNTAYPTHDANAANDTAALTVQLTGTSGATGGTSGGTSGGTTGGTSGGSASGSTGGGTTGATGTSTTGTTGSTGSTGGGLADTGAGGIGLIAGAAVVVLGAGIGSVAYARRRRSTGLPS
jgi:hypothetical protein